MQAGSFPAEPTGGFWKLRVGVPPTAPYCAIGARLVLMEAGRPAYRTVCPNNFAQRLIALRAPPRSLLGVGNVSPANPACDLAGVGQALAWGRHR